MVESQSSGVTSQAIILQQTTFPDIEMTMDWWGKIVIKSIYRLVLDIWECRINAKFKLCKIRILKLDIVTVTLSFVLWITQPNTRLVIQHLGTIRHASAQKRYRTSQPSIHDSFPTIPQQLPHTHVSPILHLDLNLPFANSQEQLPAYLVLHTSFCM